MDKKQREELQFNTITNLLYVDDFSGRNKKCTNTRKIFCIRKILFESIIIELHAENMITPMIEDVSSL